MNRFHGWIFGAAWMLASTMAFAEPSQSARDAAKKLYDQAAREMDRGSYASACAKFEEALKLTPNHIRTAISLGDCKDRLGKPASAMAHLQQAMQWAVEQGKKDKVAEIASLATALDGRIPHLTIVVPDYIRELPGLTILRDATIVAKKDWDKPIPTDPGVYEVMVSADNKPTWYRKVKVKLGQTKEMTIEPPTWGRPPAIKRTLGFVGIGVGAAAMVTGGILGGIAVSKNNESLGHTLCNARNECIREGYDLRTSALQYGNASTALFIAGGLFAAGGVTLLVLSRSRADDDDESTDGQTSLWIGPSGLGVRGSW